MMRYDIVWSIVARPHLFKNGSWYVRPKICFSKAPDACPSPQRIPRILLRFYKSLTSLYPLCPSPTAIWITTKCQGLHGWNTAPSRIRKIGIRYQRNWYITIPHCSGNISKSSSKRKSWLSHKMTIRGRLGELVHIPASEYPIKCSSHRKPSWSFVSPGLRRKTIPLQSVWAR